MTFTVAILGRPNVGKSTLFNRLIGRREALVDDTPGVTRDRREGETRLAGHPVRFVDTAGLEEAPPDSLAGRMRAQTGRALETADLALLVIDARAGLTPLDTHFADWLRRQPVPVLLVANKCEGRAADAGLMEAYALGLGDPVPVSAAHGEGIADLVQALRAHGLAESPEAAPGGDGAAVSGDVGTGEDVPPDLAADVEADGDLTEEGALEDALEEDDDAAPLPAGPLRLAIVGRPNVGKSTLINALLGEERMLTGPEPGVTRDAIRVAWRLGDRPVVLVDTAGLRKRARVTDRLERLSTADTMEAVRLAHVVVLVMDAAAVLERQELTIARHVLDEGRALVVALNKWDAVDDRKAARAALADRLQVSLPQARGVATVTVSALREQGLDRLLDAVLETERVWNRRVSTGRLNRWLAAMTAQHTPPLVAGRRLKLRYMTQVKARPPTFALWVSRPDALPDAYRRYLVNGLRDAFDMPGVPIRLMLRRGRNPYAD
jgi:GTP-binding protein